MKKAILLLSLFAVSSCSGTPLVPSSTEEPSSTPEMMKKLKPLAKTD